MYGLRPRRALAWCGLLIVLLLTECACAGSGGADPNHLLRDRQARVATLTHHAEVITDGVIAKPGTPWNSALASAIMQGCGVEWDLGRVERVRRAWIQADADNRYVVRVSTDGATWAVAWEAPQQEGTGLQARSTEALDVPARYVRVEPRGGNTDASVSELVLSSTTAGPWPPKLEQRAHDRPHLPGRSRWRWPVLLAAVLGGVVLFGPGQMRRAAQRKLLSRLARGRPRLRKLLALAVRAPAYWITLVLSVFLIVTALWYAALHRFNLVDDAYISLQYAKSWASGQGLVFNPGERVEGYTNFLWVALLAPLWPLSGHDPYWMARASTWLTIGLAVVELGLLAVIARKVLRHGWLLAGFVVLYVALDDTTISYTVVFAMENHLMAVCMLAGLALSVWRPKHWQVAVGASFALVCMTRLDGALWVGTFFVAHGVFRARVLSDRPLFSWRDLLRIAAVFAVLFIPYFVLRAWYFGDLLPNTFYLKSGSLFAGLTRGLGYLRGYMNERLWVPLLAVPALVLVRAAWVRWLVLFAVVHIAYVLHIGGDFYAGHRYLFVVTPCLALLGVAVLDHVTQQAPWLTLERLAFVALLCCLTIRWATVSRGGIYADYLYGRATTDVDNNVKYMQWVKAVARPGATMAVGDIGATGLFSDVTVVDVFGVVDPTISHRQVAGFGTGWTGHEKRMSREDQLARRPTYIKWGYINDVKWPAGYYIFNDFPPHLRVEGLWVLDDLDQGRALLEGTWHINRKELRDWTVEGSPLSHVVSGGARQGQRVIVGARGTLINTYAPRIGDRATVRLLSPPFELKGDRIRLLVGGGTDEERLRVSLLVDAERVFSETGTCWETLGRRQWDITPLRGQTARIEIVDEAIGAWGHLLVDEIEQWAGTPNTTGRL